MNSTQDFDARARTWDDDPMKAARAQAVADAIRRSIPNLADMHGLEFGCGTGLLSFALQAHLKQIVLADSSPGMLEVLREKIAASRIANMTPIQLDLTSDPLPEQRFELIYSLMTLHHIPDTEAVLRDMHALLRQPGDLGIADLDSEDGSFHGQDADVHQGFDRQGLTEKAERAGFRNISFSNVFEIHKGQPERIYPVFLMTAEKP